MKRIWIAGGRVAFWLSWPLLFLYLLRSERTRIVVVCQGEVLVVRGWLGGGKWNLPGGGLHRGEDPAEGAVRELQEETGIEVNATELQKFFSGRIKTGLRYTVHAYGIELDKKPRLSKQKIELTHLAWIDGKELLNSPKTAADVQNLIAAFYDKMKSD
jgi:8-oxo-dGTP pyrophosphatase MutT (NUDIX family)